MESGHASRHPLRERLEEASDSKWSGHIAVFDEYEEIGVVVLHEGRVAWSVCRFQPEDLGTFLWRLGHITHEQLQTMERKYMEEGKKKKLGTLLEEAGLIRKPVLRLCLRLHVRMALASLFRHPHARIKSRELQFEVDPERAFSLLEVLPEVEMTPGARVAASTNAPSTNWSAWSGQSELLADLTSIHGYCASMITTRCGQILAAHTAQNQVNPSVVSSTLLMLFEFAQIAVDRLAIGQVEYVLVDCRKAKLLAGWIDPARSMIMMALIDERKSLGITWHQLRAMAEKMVGNLASKTSDVERGAEDSR